MTAEELLAVPRGYGHRHELIAGELITLPAGGANHGLVAANMGFPLGTYVEAHRLGVTVGPCGFQLSRDPDTVLAPDAAFIAADRVVDTWGCYPGAPDLAVEVVNFDETLSDMERRASQWVAAGTRMVIVADPRTEAVIVVTPDGKTHPAAGDIITGGDVVPGWSIAVRDIFE